MERYNIEITDTYGGEANYSWVKRYAIEANSERGAVQKLARQHGGGWRKEWFDGETSRYNMRGAAICMFVTIQY